MLIIPVPIDSPLWRPKASICQRVDRLVKYSLYWGLRLETLRGADQSANSAGELLYEISTALAQAKTLEAIGAVVAGIAVNIPACTGLVVCVLDATRTKLDLVGSWGIPPEADGNSQSFPLSSNMPVAVAARTGEELWIEHARQWAGLLTASQYASTACLPMLSTSGSTLGAIRVGYGVYRTFTDSDHRFLRAVAAQCSTAVERCLLFQEERASRQKAEEGAARIALMLQLTQALAVSGVTFQQVAKKLTELLAEALHGACVVRMKTADDERLRTVASSHVNAEAKEFIGAVLENLGETPPDIGFLPDVLARGETLFLPHVPESLLRQYASPPFDAFLNRFGLTSIVVVPLRLDGQIRGLLTVARGFGDAPFGEADKALVEEAAHRASVYLETAVRREETTQALQQRDQFLSMAAHELKTPLTSLSLLNQFVAHRAATLTADDLRNYAEIGKKQIGQLIKLVNDMVDVARIRSNRLAMHFEPTDLATIVHEQAVLIGGVEPYPNFQLAIEPVTGLWDPARLSQVVVNLLNNATKFGRGNPIDLRLRKTGAWAELRVADRGIGIAAEKIGRIFLRFERAVSDRHYEGLGLGLFIVKEIVEAHGGEISVASELERGTEFTVRLPLENNP